MKMQNSKIPAQGGSASGGKIQNLLLILAIGGLLLLPLVSLAGEYIADGQTIHYEGLVPCGGEGQPACQLCHFFVMFAGIVNFVVGRLVPVLAALFLVIGGIMFFLAGGSPETLGKAKKLLTSVVMGLVIIYGAWLFVNFILTFPGLINPKFGWNPSEWFIVSCGEEAAPGVAPVPESKEPISPTPPTPPTETTPPGEATPPEGTTPPSEEETIPPLPPVPPAFPGS